MDNINVILCGTDTFQVESMLQGAVEKQQYAWNKRYRFSCTRDLSVDRLDSRLLLICNVVILCRGCRSPKSTDAYHGRPILSLPDATPACVEEVHDAENYYGPATLEGLRAAVVSIALTPPHVVYDTLLQCFTPLGEAAYQRAFWLLDRDNDGRLNRDELLAWARLTRAAKFTEEDLAAFLDGEAAAAGPFADGPFADSCVTEQQFTELHQNWLDAGDFDSAWATLHAVGTHPDGLPNTWYDLNSMRIDRDVNTYLSPQAMQFLRNIYKLKNFKDPAQDIWRVTPGCPWSHMDGLPSSATIPLDRFIECWKYMALERRDVVITYARYWGYKGDANFLFVQRSARVSRDESESLPNTLQVLVVGDAGCGRKSLIFQLTTNGKEHYDADPEAAIYVRTTTFFADKVGGSGGSVEEAQTIVYTAISPDKAEIILSNESLNRTFDVVLLCVDGGHYAASAEYAMHLYSSVSQLGACPKMPFLLVMTKSDLLDNENDNDGAGATGGAVGGNAAVTATFTRFATANRLLWPPVMTSATRPEESEIAVLNEYMYTVARNPDLAVGKPPVTWVKLLRRGTFTAIVLVGSYGILQNIGKWILSRRKK